jgi:hypothetical protein
MGDEIRVVHAEDLLKQHARIDRIDSAGLQSFRDIQDEIFVN